MFSLSFGKKLWTDRLSEWVSEWVTDQGKDQDKIRVSNLSIIYNRCLDFPSCTDRTFRASLLPTCFYWKYNLLSDEALICSPFWWFGFQYLSQRFHTLEQKINLCFLLSWKNTQHLDLLFLPTCCSWNILDFNEKTISQVPSYLDWQILPSLKFKLVFNSL